MFKKLAKRFYSWTNTKWCFRSIVGLFAFSAGWIAVSSQYPMAYDEDFHLSVIKLYAHHLSPFFSSAPAGTEKLGVFFRDPSYLYHYIMSFPWRLITLATNNFMVQVITMRLLNVILFASSLFIFRALLGKTKHSCAAINFVILLFVLTPIVSQLAAQINYDNLFIPLVGLSMLLTVQIAEKLRDQKKLDLTRLFALISLGFLTSLVKYAFLPIFAAIGLYLLMSLVLRWRRDQLTPVNLFIQSAKQVSVRKLILLGAILLATGGLFVRSYAPNLIQYHAIAPPCEKVLSVDSCMANGPWKRNYDIARAGLTPTYNRVQFTAYWFQHMAYNLMFALNGPNSGYVVGSPIILPQVALVLLLVSGLLGLGLNIKRLLSNPVLLLFGLIIGIYLYSLWTLNYSAYHQLGIPVAVQGRYLVPILVPFYLLLVVSITHMFHKHVWVQRVAASLAIGLMFTGGGAITYIARSDDSWYWSNKTIVTINSGARNVLSPIILSQIKTTVRNP